MKTEHLYFLGFLFGGIILLCSSSMAQKYFIMGINPFDVNLFGYVVPIIFGGISGGIMGLLGFKVLDLNKKLKVDIITLSGLIPICANCKKIRDDKGYWNQLESYIEKHSEAQFSHGICEECAEELYGDSEWFKKRKTKKGDV